VSDEPEPSRLLADGVTESKTFNLRDRNGENRRSRFAKLLGPAFGLKNTSTDRHGFFLENPQYRRGLGFSPQPKLQKRTPVQALMPSAPTKQAPVGARAGSFSRGSICFFATSTRQIAPPLEL